MNKIFYFLMVSVAFTVLQVGTVAAEGTHTESGGERVDRAHPDDADRGHGFTGEESQKRGAVATADMGRDHHAPANVGTCADGDDTIVATAPDVSNLRNCIPQDHKVGQERWDPAMGGKGTPTMQDDQTTGMKAPHQSPR
jgi:hypothetical protein